VLGVCLKLEQFSYFVRVGVGYALLNESQSGSSVSFARKLALSGEKLTLLMLFPFGTEISNAFVTDGVEL
jgi:type IV secretory pathway TrbL component